MKLMPVIFIVAIFGLAESSFAQGFVNLDFESANISGYPPEGFSVPASNAIPGWTAYISGIPQSSVLYNDEALGDAAISLQGTNGIYQPIQGRYFVLLQATFFAAQTNTTAVGQTGLIPVTDQSLTFWGNTSLSGVSNDLQVTFNGSNISYSAIGSGTGYTIYGADISAFAGQTGQLLFTAYNDTYAELDNIQFSPSAIPEPSEFALAALGAICLGFCHRRR